MSVSSITAIRLLCPAARPLSKQALGEYASRFGFQPNETLMAIDAATVKKVANLARIREPEARLEPLAQELNAILAWIEQLAEVDTDGVEPMTSVVAAKLPMREDVVTDGDKVADILANAPKSANGFFIVPKVVE
jgi:aspartyl-tRNA(Asn)/glutamyl-tRNA(Gln) amidotransferase subunit C